MSNILVIQPHKILQHAIALFLFPHHQARMMTSIPESSEITDVDAVIVDAASLREIHGLSAAVMGSLQDWKIPMIWIDSVDSPLTPSDENLVVVKTPITRQSLESALAKCLAVLARRARKGNRMTNQEARSAGNAPSSEKSVKGEVIELLDVVEEAAKS